MYAHFEQKSGLAIEKEHFIYKNNEKCIIFVANKSLTIIFNH